MRVAQNTFNHSRQKYTQPAGGGWRPVKELSESIKTASATVQKQQTQSVEVPPKESKATGASLQHRAKLKDTTKVIQTSIFSLLPPEGTRGLMLFRLKSNTGHEGNTIMEEPNRGLRSSDQIMCIHNAAQQDSAWCSTVAVAAAATDAEDSTALLAIAEAHRMKPGEDIKQQLQVALQQQDHIGSTPGALSRLEYPVTLLASLGLDNAGVGGGIYALSKYVSRVSRRLRVKYEKMVQKEHMRYIHLRVTCGLTTTQKRDNFNRN